MTRPPARVATALAVIATLATSAGCVPGSDRTVRTEVSTVTRTQTFTRTPVPTTQGGTPLPTYSARPAATVTPLLPGASPPRGESERRCPYLASSPEQDASRNVADIVGSHVYRTTVLIGDRPVGCRFYFYAPPYNALADIVPARFASPRQAYAAMLAISERGSQRIGVRDLVPGVDAVLYRTAFYGGDGRQDWACVFAAGRTTVVVRTQRADASQYARLLARAVARRF